MGLNIKISILAILLQNAKPKVANDTHQPVTIGVYRCKNGNRDLVLTEAAGLTLGLHKSEHVALTARALDVTDDLAVVVAGGSLSHEGDADLGNVTAGAGAAKDLGHNTELVLVGGLGNDLLGGVLGGLLGGGSGISHIF